MQEAITDLGVVVVQACNLSTREAETGWRSSRPPGLLETLSQQEITESCQRAKRFKVKVLGEP